VIDLRVEQPDGRPAVMLEDVCTTDVAGVRATPPSGGESIVRVGSTRACADPAPASTLGPRGDGKARWRGPDDDPSALD